MSRCFPFPPPGYENEKKSSNVELGNLQKKIKHKDKKEKKEERKEKSKDEEKVNHMETEKKDKKHKHHKHKKDKSKDRDNNQNREKHARIMDRHGGHEFEDKKRPGDAQDSPKKGEELSIKFVEIERPGNGKCTKIVIPDREETRQNDDKTRNNDMGGDQKIDKDRGKSSGNARKRKEIERKYFLHFGNAEDSPKRREAVSIKFVERERQGNRKCDKIDLSDRDGSRQNNDKTRDNGMEEHQKNDNDRGNSNGKVRKSKEINTNYTLHVGDAQESTKKREAVSIKFVDRERLGNGKCHKINLSDREGSRQNNNTRDNGMEGDQKFDKNRDKSNDIVRKRKKIDTNSSPHGNQLWIQLPVLTDKDRQSNKCCRTVFTEEVHSDIGRTTQEVLDGVVECVPTSCVQKASNAYLGKCVDSISFLPSFSGKNMQSKKSLPTAFAKEVYSDTGRTVQEVKDDPVECIPKTTIQEASNAVLEKCVASTSCHPSFSGKNKQSNRCPQTAFAKEFHFNIGKNVQEEKDCTVECIPGSRVQEVSISSLDKCVASTSCHPSFSGKDKWSNKRPQTSFVEEFHSDIWRKVQEAKNGAVECLPESGAQEASNAALKKCDASTSCHPPFSDKDKRSNKHPRTAFTKEVLSDIGRTAQEATDGPVECLSEGRVQEASNATLQKCVTCTCCLPSFSGKHFEQNGAADCKTYLHFGRPSPGNIQALDVVPSGTRTDEHILDLKYFHCVPPKQGWSDVDDQAWLLKSNDRKRKASVKFDHASNVWDRALFLQPNNIFALPYVTWF